MNVDPVNWSGQIIYIYIYYFSNQKSERIRAALPITTNNYLSSISISSALPCPFHPHQTSKSIFGDDLPKKSKKKSTKYVGDDSKKKPGNLPGRSPNRSPTEILISNHLSHEMVMSSHLQYQYQSYCLVSPFTDSSINPQYLG